MSEHMFFQGNPSGKADDAPSELSTLSVLCELLGKVDALEQRISDVIDATLYDFAMLEKRIDALERRTERIEKLLSHKTGKLAGKDLGAVFLDELGQEEQGGADELADD